MSAKDLFSEVDFLTNQPSSFLFFFLVLALSFISLYRNEFSVISVQENTGFNNTLNLSDSFFYISLLSLQLNSSYHSLRFFYYDLITLQDVDLALETCTVKNIPERYQSLFTDSYFNKNTDLCLVPGQNVTVSENFLF